jgi:hypothetical protein
MKSMLLGLIIARTSAMVDDRYARFLHVYNHSVEYDDCTTLHTPPGQSGESCDSTRSNLLTVCLTHYNSRPTSPVRRYTVRAFYAMLYITHLISNPFPEESILW